MMLGHLVTSGTLLISLFVFAACMGGASSSDDVQAQLARDSKALEDLYLNVQGTWSGKLTLVDGTEALDAEMKVYIDFVQQGMAADGRPINRPTLNARFQPKNFVTETDLIDLVGSYDRSGRFVMSPQSGAGGASSGVAAAPKSLTLSVAGTVGSGNMNVVLTRKGGTWGTFTAARTSTLSPAPRSGEITENRERYYRIYQPIEGFYTGRLRSVHGNDYNVGIYLVINEQPTAAGIAVPVLVARYVRLDAPAGTVEWVLSVDYNTQTGGILMGNASPVGGGSGGSGGGGSGGGGMSGHTLSAIGKLSEVGGMKQMDLKVRNGSEAIGTITAVRSGGSNSRLPSAH